MSSTPLFRLPDIAHAVRLPDGRKLGYAEYGDPGGRPVFFFHGTPGSRLTLLPTDHAASTVGLRVIAPERPGYGLSDFQTGRRLLDWPADVLALADALKIERFAVIGLSGGGPHALACAAQIPDRLTRCLLVCALGPTSSPEFAAKLPLFSRLTYGIGRRLPFNFLQLALRPSARRAAREPEMLIPRMLRFLPDVDRRVLCDRTIVGRIQESQVEAYRSGPAATAWETLLLLRPWGFDLPSIQVPVHFWHGELDKTVPVSLVRAMERILPNCTATYYPDEGHFLIYRHWPDILAVL
jgi:pimeloyl-ACP methyl ester carboxylesterase